MLQVIITATLLITGIFATTAQVRQTVYPKSKVCLEAKWEANTTNFHSKQNTYLFQKDAKMKIENERATI
ncbi:hypothetical protein [Flavobacterium tegetincola]|uniref:hypothetical protein n=1 Tax=Flavobacterium tegetincola TaxID=150172 RepID=UPI0004276B23|nr:hypothetical protein [Flavobacterium tegetincola]